MYARKYGHLSDNDAAREIQIPDKYDGNAFEAFREATEEISEEASPKKSQPKEEKAQNEEPPFKGLSKAFSSDTLLLLLAFLLMGSDEGDELSSILIFLMLL